MKPGLVAGLSMLGVAGLLASVMAFLPAPQIKSEPAAEPLPQVPVARPVEPASLSPAASTARETEPSAGAVLTALQEELGALRTELGLMRQQQADLIATQQAAQVAQAEQQVRWEATWTDWQAEQSAQRARELEALNAALLQLNTARPTQTMPQAVTSTGGPAPSAHSMPVVEVLQLSPQGQVLAWRADERAAWQVGQVGTLWDASGRRVATVEVSRVEGAVVIARLLEDGGPARSGLAKGARFTFKLLP